MGWRLSAALGLAGWVIGQAVYDYPLGISLFLLAPLVLVPLTLALLEETPSRLWLAIRLLQPPAALLLLPLSPWLSLPWLVLTGLIALAGLLRFARHRFASVPELGSAAGMIYLAVGGGWMLLARLGERPLDFPDVIVQATATHFHYAGFILPVLAGRAAGVLNDRWSRLAVWGAIVGVPLVAAGITLSAFGVRWPEWLAAWFMAAAGSLLAVQQLRLAWRNHADAKSAAQRVLFTVSGVSLLAAMTLAAAYALGNCLQVEWLDIPAMIRTHGVLNVFGFALPGVLASQLAIKHGVIDALPKAVNWHFAMEAEVECSGA